MAERVGILQGSRRSGSAIWSGTISLLLRLAVAIAAALLGWTVAGMLGAVVFGVASGPLLATAMGRGLRRPAYNVFTGVGRDVLVMTALWAWLLNADVIVMRIAADPLTAGHYASAAAFVKATVVVPTALAYYLLPRFVQNRGNAALAQRAQGLLLTLTAAVGLAASLVFWLAGSWLARLAFGDAYDAAGQLLLPLSVAFIPWLMAQAVLIRLTASPGRFTSWLLAGLAVVQVPLILLLVGNVMVIIVAQGVIGTVGVLGFLLASRRLNQVPDHR